MFFGDLVFGLRSGERDGSRVEAVDVVELHDLVAVLCPPLLRLHSVEHLTAGDNIKMNQELNASIGYLI